MKLLLNNWALPRSRPWNLRKSVPIIIRHGTCLKLYICQWLGSCLFLMSPTLSNGLACSVEGYWAWTYNMTNPNYLYMQQQIFTFLHAIMLLRDATRKGDGQAVIMAKRKLAPLFYGRNHIKYQKICVHNLIVECLMPNTVKAIVMDSLSLSRTGHSGHYQGGDACLEEINKAAKSWIPCTGVPLDKHWLKVFRNLERLDRVSYYFVKCWFYCVSII